MNETNEHKPNIEAEVAKFVGKTLSDAVDERDARIAELERRVEGEANKRKETAKDFETAFRTVRLENDTLRAEVERLTQEARLVSTALAGAFPDSDYSNSEAIKLIRSAYNVAHQRVATLQREREAAKDLAETAFMEKTTLATDNVRLRAQLAEREEDGARLDTRHNPAESALNAAREAIENAPHTLFCPQHAVIPNDRPCTCWKAEALAQIDKALSPQQSKTT